MGRQVLGYVQAIGPVRHLGLQLGRHDARVTVHHTGVQVVQDLGLILVHGMQGWQVGGLLLLMVRVIGGHEHKIEWLERRMGLTHRVTGVQLVAQLIRRVRHVGMVFVVVVVRNIWVLQVILTGVGNHFG